MIFGAGTYKLDIDPKAISEFYHFLGEYSDTCLDCKNYLGPRCINSYKLVEVY